MRPTLPRLALLALATLAPAAAGAADYGYPDTLRGTHFAEPPPMDEIVSWQGAYLGLFGGYSQASFGLSGAVRNEVAGILSHTSVESEFAASRWLALGDKVHRDASYGGFAGYNYQSDEIVFGIEADFTHTRLIGSGSAGIGRSVSTKDGYFNEVYLNGQASAEINDYGTLRARIGYTSGMLMPYFTAGAALGNATLTRSVGAQAAGYHEAQRTAAYSQYLNTGVMGSVPNYGYAAFNPITLQGTLAPAQTATRTKETVVGGFAAGVGVDVAVTQNIFLRGEYQYVYFDSFEGNKFHINTLRAAAGVRW